jgi:hypothetical protein
LRVPLSSGADGLCQILGRVEQYGHQVTREVSASVLIATDQEISRIAQTTSPYVQIITTSQQQQYNTNLR